MNQGKRVGDGRREREKLSTTFSTERGTMDLGKKEA